MSTRRELLINLFRQLEERQVPYCVLRNYENLFDEQTSDVDLLTLPERAAEVMECCQRAGKATGHVLVQRARFINHSLVFWNGAANLLRIDVDTEKRWKRFHLLTAAEILNTRQKHDGFYVPDGPHEAVVVLAQTLWRGKLSERYAKRLMGLQSIASNNDELCTLFEAAFGLRKNWLATIEDPKLPQALACAVHGSFFRSPRKLWHSLAYLVKDASRFLTRRRSPQGLFIRCLGVDEKLAQDLIARLAILFPSQKSVTSHAPMDAAKRAGVMFKGGLAIELLPAQSNPAARLRTGWPEADRSFAMVCASDRSAQFIHVGSGVMGFGKGAEDFMEFICKALARFLTRVQPPAPGAFVVLLGLDGAGKTTLARNLAGLVGEESAWAGVRYFHWLPGWRKTFTYPLPEPGNQPRKPRLCPGIGQSFLSVLRLIRSLIRAQLAWWLQLQPLRQRGYLVLVDRYFYNYYLDPVSVKYYGPQWVLDLLSRWFPKPEIVITLSASPEVLLQRKQELSEAEMRVQMDALAQLKFPTVHVIAADACDPAEIIAAKVITELRKRMS